MPILNNIKLLFRFHINYTSLQSIRLNIRNIFI
nr:MAG TPA: hypothetical protein [Bacteriophage sp.]